MTDGATPTPFALARELREARDALLEVARTLPETKAYRGTARAGWTLKHELAQLVAMDAELVHLAERARHRTAGAVVDLAEAIDLRRLRGRAMHAAQEMRLGPLRDHLDSMGERAASAIETSGEHLQQPLAAAGREAETLLDLARAQVERARTSIEAIRQHIS
jgi:hypothetical protein